MSSISEGDQLPTFSMPASNGETVTNNTYAGRNLLLFFYPRDDTSGCTKEAVAFTALAAEFEAAGTALLGVSKDSIAAHEKFIAKHALGVTLASDEHGDFCERMGVWAEKSMYGKKFWGIERSTFLVAADGTVLKMWRKVKVPGHAEETLTAARAAG